MNVSSSSDIIYMDSAEVSSMAISSQNVATSNNISTAAAMSSTSMVVSAVSIIFSMESAEVSSIAISSHILGTSADISKAPAVSSTSMVVSALSDIIPMESPEVSTRAIYSQKLDASAKDTSPADISAATISPGECVYSSPGPSFSTNSRSVSTIASMVVSPSSDFSSTESTDISGFSPLDLNEPAPLTRVLNVSTSVDLSKSVHNTEESPADVLNALNYYLSQKKLLGKNFCVNLLLFIFHSF